MPHKIQPFIVLGASGAQGGAVADAFLTAGLPVRVMLRDPQSATAQALTRRGAEVVAGDMDDSDSLARAFAGGCGVFSVQVLGDKLDPDYEIRTGLKIIDAARATDIAHFIQTSVARVGEHESFTDWSTRGWGGRYWTDKATVVAAARASGFPHLTILKPAFMMENFAQPRAAWMFPSLARGALASAYRSGTVLDLVAARDIGAFTLAAFRQPEVFDRAEIALAGDRISVAGICAALSQVKGRAFDLATMSPAEAIATGMSPGVVQNQEWSNLEGYQVDISATARWNIPLTRFHHWLEANVARLSLGN